MFMITKSYIKTITIFAIMFTPAGNTNKKEIERIRRLVDARLNSLYGSVAGFKYESVIAETLCTEPDCVPIETIIGIILVDSEVKTSIEPSRYTTKVLRPLIEVKQMDILGISFPFRVVPAAQRKAEAPAATEISTTIPAKVAQDDIETEQVVCKRLLSSLKEGLSTLQDINSWKRMKEDLQREVNDLDIKIKIRLSEEKVTKVTILPSTSGKVEELTETNTTPTVFSQSITNPTKNTLKPPDSDIIIVKKNEMTGPVISAVNAYSKSVARNNASSAEYTSRHDKNKPKSGCPCCDPDNLDHVVDKLLFLERPGI